MRQLLVFALVGTATKISSETDPGFSAECSGCCGGGCHPIERSGHLDSEMVAVSILDRMQLGGLRVPKSRFLRASRKSDHLAADWAVVQ